MQVNTPPMGWNSWNTFGSKISGSMIKETADKLIELGLDKAGYRYLVIDDGWSLPERDAKTDRIVTDSEKFPEGMKSIADYVHSKNLKFGMYSCAGFRTCLNLPGSFDHEFLDAEMFAEIGIDFLKYDFCFVPRSACGPVLYRRMGNALRACGRDILFSACNWGSDDVWSWIRSAGAHMYRSTGDIHDTPVSYANIAKSQLQKYCYSAPGCFNDMDMLTVGMYGKGNVGTKEEELSSEEKKLYYRRYVSQFTLWCIMGSPLMLGCDLRNITPEILELVTNKELIAINQDPECRPAFLPAFLPGKSAAPDAPALDVPVLVKLLSDGTLAAGVFNFTDRKNYADLFYDDIGFPVSSGYDLEFRNLLTGETDVSHNGSMWGFYNLEPYEARIFKITPVKKSR